MNERAWNTLRPIEIIPNYLEHPEGSCLISCGNTKVLCTATIETRVPKWMHGQGKGWITAEYDMLPRATNTRTTRDARKGKVKGRTQEISRLIGRALRSVASLDALGELNVVLDCDVIQADGGTRTTSITGAYVALASALQNHFGSQSTVQQILKDQVVALSVGLVQDEIRVDLDYALDSAAQVDMNIVMTGQGQLIEVQGTGEESTFSHAQLNTMLESAFKAAPLLCEAQKQALGWT
ncbi:MAG: ribonuclease PH [Myxococcota bacterium]|jgi:ribonuclease PH|nr:ribonuclease PH [Myxococcota bacterium]